MSHDLLSCLCGQLENEVAKVLFTAFYPPIQKGTPSTGWLYFGDVKKKKKKKKTNGVHVLYHQSYSTSLDLSWLRWTWAFKRASTTPFWAL